MYCQYCGKKVGLSGKCTCQESKENSTPKSNKRISVKMIAVVSIIIVVIAAVCLITTSAKIDPFNYITVEYEGINGSGKAQISFSEKEMIEEIIGEEPNVLNQEYLEWDELRTTYSNNINYTISQEDSLSNGDVITITFTCTGNAKSKFKSGEKEFTVNNLSELTPVDVFSEVDVIFEGISGEATLTVNNKSDNEFIKGCSFEYENNGTYKNGDVVTINVVYSEKHAKDTDCCPKESKKDFTVSGLASYLDSADKIPVSLVRELADSLLAEVKSDGDTGEMGLVDTNYTYLGAYFLTKKESNSVGYNNELRIIVSHDNYLNGAFRWTVFECLSYKNIIEDTNGNFSFSYDSIWGDKTKEINFENGNIHIGSSVEEMKEELKDEYTITEIG